MNELLLAVMGGLAVLLVQASAGAFKRQLDRTNQGEVKATPLMTLALRVGMKCSPRFERSRGSPSSGLMMGSRRSMSPPRS